MSRVRATVVIAGEFIAFAPIVEAGSIVWMANSQMLTKFAIRHAQVALHR